MKTSLDLGENTFLVQTINPRRSFRLQAQLFPLVVEIAGAFFKIAKANEPKKKKQPETEDAPEGHKGEDDDEVKEEAAHFERMLKVMEADTEELLPTISNVLALLTADDLETLQRELLSNTLVDGHRLFGEGGDARKFDAAMGGRTLDTWRLMWEAVKVTYPDFLSPLLGRLARAGVKKQLPSEV